MPAGVELTSYSIGSDGKLRGIFSDDVQRDLAQVALADFNNPMGLEKVGETVVPRVGQLRRAQIGVSGEGRRGTSSEARSRCPTSTSPPSSPT